MLAAALERVRLASEVVETAALRRGDVVKTALLRTVSHDLRSPLTAILTASDFVASPTVDAAEREELAGVIRQEAGRLARLVDNLLDLSRLQAGAAEPRREWCAIDEVILSAAEGLDASGGAVSLSLDRELPLLRADAAQLERAVANVLENALRHSGELYGQLAVVGRERRPAVEREIAGRERMDRPAHYMGDDEIAGVGRLVIPLARDAFAARGQGEQRRVAREVGDGTRRRLREARRAAAGEAPRAGESEGENPLRVHVA